MSEPTDLSGIEVSVREIVGALAAGTVLCGGSFKLIEALGQGGFGITYLARDLELERDVVIKECFPEAVCIRTGKDVAVRSSSGDAHFRKCVEMFTREARSIARLNHPNILPVHRIFKENETAYTVLDLIEGPSLLEIIEDPSHRLSTSDVKAMTTKTLEALSVVHSHNLLHRDIAPDNILIDEAGQPVLIDFGSARELASERTRQKTRIMYVKDGYSPFEFYVAGAAHAPSSDLYALGGTIYHLVAQEAPPSSEMRNLAVQAGNPDPYQPLLGRYPAHDNAFLSAIDQALELQPYQRIQSAERWLEQITKKQEGVEPVGRSLGRKLPVELGNLITETNRQVSQDLRASHSPADAAGATPTRPETTLEWRDEFNQETQQILEEASAAETAEVVDSAAQSELDQGPAHSSLFTKFVGWFSRWRHAGISDEEIEKLLLQAYLQNERKRKRRSAESIGSSATIYILVAALCALFAMLVAVNNSGLNNEGYWLSVFSIRAKGSCRDENTSSWSLVRTDCSESGNVNRLDLSDRSRIREFD